MAHLTDAASPNKQQADARESAGQPVALEVNALTSPRFEVEQAAAGTQLGDSPVPRIDEELLAKTLSQMYPQPLPAGMRAFLERFGEALQREKQRRAGAPSNETRQPVLPSASEIAAVCSDLQTRQIGVNPRDEQTTTGLF